MKSKRKEKNTFEHQYNEDGYFIPLIDEILARDAKIEKGHMTLQELRDKCSFHSGESDLSQRVDEIVYGIGRDN